MDPSLYNVQTLTQTSAIATLNSLGGNQKLINCDTALGQSWFH